MNCLNQKIENHFHTDELDEDILSGHKKHSIDLNFVPKLNLAAVDEFHIRRTDISNEIAKSIALIRKICFRY